MRSAHWGSTQHAPAPERVPPPIVYGPPPPGTLVSAPTSTTLSLTGLIVGIVSIVAGWALALVPAVGLVFSILGLKKEPAGRALAIIGIVTNGIGVLIVLLVFVLPIVFVGTAFLGAALSSST